MSDSPGKQKELGLALGGGGIRGLAHIGVLKSLTRAGIPIACIAGTSAGALVGAAYAAGMTPERLEEDIAEIASLSGILSFGDWWPGKRSLFSGASIYKYFAGLVGDTRLVEEMRIPFAAVAVDLVTGEEIVLREGKVDSVLAATIAMPGVFDPVRKDERILVDGGLRNNVPIDVAQSLGADFVLAVDVSTPVASIAETGLAERWTIANDLTRALGIMMRSMTEYRLQLSPPNMLIVPTLPTGVTALSGLQHFEEIVKAGEDAAEAILPSLKSQLGIPD